MMCNFHGIVRNIILDRPMMTTFLCEEGPKVTSKRR